MRGLWGLVILLSLPLLWGQEPLPPALLTLRVVDSEGKPIAGARVGGLLVDHRQLLVLPATQPFWQSTDAEGVCSVRWAAAHEPALREVWYGERRGIVYLLVGAPGYRAHLLAITHPAPAEHTIALAPAQPLEVELYPVHAPPDDFGTAPVLNKPLPLLELWGRPPGELSVTSPTPLYQETHLGDRYERLPTLVFGLMPNFGVERLTPTRYRVWLPADVQPPLALLINRPDWLWGYLAFIDADALARRRLALDLPRSGELVVRVDISQYPVSDSRERVLILGRADAEEARIYALRTVFLDQPVQEIRLENLAPSSEWQLRLALYAPQNNYSAQRKFRIRPAETRTLQLRYEPFDPDRYKGNRQLTLRFIERDGSPVANHPLQVVLYLPGYEQSITVAQGRTDAQGRLRLQNLYELPQPPQTPSIAPRYFVYSQGDYPSLAEFILVRGDGQQEIVVQPRLQEGDLAPDIEMTDLRTGQTRRLSEFRGRFVLLDFWATWCTPCHRALEQLHQAWTQLEPAQRERLQIILVSIDEQARGVLGFLQQRGWDALGEVMWAGKGGWMAPAAQAFRIDSIPRQILIDPSGRIAVLEVRKPIGALLQELETLTGRLPNSTN